MAQKFPEEFMFCVSSCIFSVVQLLQHVCCEEKNTSASLIGLSYSAVFQFRQAKTEIVSASKVAYRFLLSATSSSPVVPDTTSNSGRGTPRFQGTWFKNLITSGAKPSSSGLDADGKEGEDVLRKRSEEDAEVPLPQNSRTDS